MRREPGGSSQGRANPSDMPAPISRGPCRLRCEAKIGRRGGTQGQSPFASAAAIARKLSDSLSITATTRFLPRRSASRARTFAVGTSTVGSAIGRTSVWNQTLYAPPTVLRESQRVRTQPVRSSPCFRTTWIFGCKSNQRSTPKTPSNGRLAARRASIDPRGIVPIEVGESLDGRRRALEVRRATRRTLVFCVVLDVVGDEAMESVGPVSAVV